MRKLAIYLRLSQEDLKNPDESDSIVGQRYLIENYIKDHKLYPKNEVVEYIDDGHSGTNMNRPGIQELLEEVKKGRIACLIVKDFSRFSRDYIELGSYMEQIFPFMKVRFISINDDYDSDKTNGGIGELDIQFKGLIYDFYSKDLSLKVKSSRNAMARKGKAVTWAAPYGYIKDPEDNNSFIIDKETAPVVKLIYELALEGLSLHKIAKVLNAREVATPAMRKKQLTNMKYNTENEKPKLWNLSSLSRITSDYTYTGALVSNRSSIKVVGAGRSTPNPREDWIIVEDCHEPIISKKIFDDVQDIKKTRTGTYKEGIRLSSPLKDLLECSNCRRKMAFIGLKRKFRYFTCRTNTISDIGCLSSFIKAEKFEDIIFKAINHKLKLYSRAIDKHNELSKKEDLDNKSLERDLSYCEKKIKDREKAIQSDYERYKLENLSREEFIVRRKLANEEIEASKKEIEDLKRSHEEKYYNIGEKLDLLIKLKSFMQVKKLTRDMAEFFIDKILVVDEEKIEIVWKFDDKLIS